MKRKRVSVVITFCLLALAAVSLAACGDPKPPQSVTIDGEAARAVDAGGSIAFTATVTPADADDKTVEWSVESGATATGASITGGGVFTAGEVPGTATVVAKSKAVPSLSDTVVVTVNAVDTTVRAGSVTISSAAGAEVAQTGTLTLTAVVMPENADNKGVDWSIKPGAQASDATVSGEGVFTAGEVVGKAVVVAASEDDPEISDEFEITVVEATYEVTFTDENGTIGTQTVKRGGTAEEPAELPVQLGQKAVWSKSLSNIKQDTVVNLVRWEWFDSYSVVFLNAAGQEIEAATSEYTGEGQAQDIVYPDEAAYQKEGFFFDEWKASREGSVFTMTPQYVGPVAVTFYGADGATPVEGYENHKVAAGSLLGDVQPAMSNTDTHNFAGWALKSDAGKTVLPNDYSIDADAAFTAVYTEKPFMTFFAGDPEKELKIGFGLNYEGIAVNYTGLIRNGTNAKEIYAAAIYTYDYFYNKDGARTDNPLDDTNLSAKSSAFAFIVDPQGRIRVMYAVTDGILIRDGENETTNQYNTYLYQGKNSVEKLIQPGEYLVVGVNGGALRAWADGKLWRGGKAAQTLDAAVTITGIDLDLTQP